MEKKYKQEENGSKFRATVELFQLLVRFFNGIYDGFKPAFVLANCVATLAKESYGNADGFWRYVVNFAYGNKSFSEGREVPRSGFNQKQARDMSSLLKDSNGK